MTAKTPPLLTLAQAADRLGLGVSMLRKLVASGEIPCVTYSAHVRLIDPGELAKWKRPARGRPRGKKK